MIPPRIAAIADRICSRSARAAAASFRSSSIAMRWASMVRAISTMWWWMPSEMSSSASGSERMVGVTIRSPCRPSIGCFAHGASAAAAAPGLRELAEGVLVCSGSAPAEAAARARIHEVGGGPWQWEASASARSPPGGRHPADAKGQGTLRRGHRCATWEVASSAAIRAPQPPLWPHWTGRRPHRLSCTASSRADTCSEHPPCGHTTVRNSHPSDSCCFSAAGVGNTRSQRAAPSESNRLIRYSAIRCWCPASRCPPSFPNSSLALLSSASRFAGSAENTLRQVDLAAAAEASSAATFKHLSSGDQGDDLRSRAEG
eukprot:m.96913 g.96913  ORF g.96913 m.96913 type:complete len:316 (+) comp12376_c0_seq3:358-1305(+)